ncbi:chromosome partitioning protein ParB [Erwinia psidii]|uniref:ParB family protein n=1 Tax=Erwinia psidii TaxID=69224 RepID=UPI00226BA2B2|nr:ParB family protein [Erwinia psidii]MCX8965985.1 chromosome partitioning protein ParB [Erwinia psidii]
MMKNDQSTLVSISLDQLRAFDLNPRITRNPDYDAIKESIKNRGLDHPPKITQRPGESFYIIASGGNTRLAILNELWLETHDKKYWNIICYFHQWQTERSIEEGNLDCLLGHLVENDKRGSLTFIERALGILRAKELYQTIHGHLSQAKLAQLLRADGYQVLQSDISKMESAVDWLLPCIPDVLYSGLSRLSVDKLLALRSTTEQFWFNNITGKEDIPAFADIFSTALYPFNESAAGFSIAPVRDELTGLISQTLGVDYNTVALVTDARNQLRQGLLGSAVPDLPAIEQQRVYQPEQKENQSSLLTEPSPENDATHVYGEPTADSALAAPEADVSSTLCQSDDILHRKSAGSADAGQADNASPLRSDIIWDIDPQLDSPEYLASIADQIAWELASVAGLEYLISPSAKNGFELAEPETAISGEARLYLQLLRFLAGKTSGDVTAWRQLLTGSVGTQAGFGDPTIIRLFRLVRTLRRLYERQQEGVL